MHCITFDLSRVVIRCLISFLPTRRHIFREGKWVGKSHLAINIPSLETGSFPSHARRDQGRASTSGSGGAEDAWSCARTRGLCRSESHSDPSCGSQRFCGDRGLAAAQQLREWTLLGRAPVEVVLGVACEWSLGPCAAASIFKVLWALWGKGVHIFPQKKFLFLFYP